MLRRRSPSPAWTLAIVSIGLFMVVLDNLVVNVALPSIHRELGASIESLEWTVNAYVLSYAVLLLTGAALGDRLGRKRMFIAGLTVFTVASAGAALAPSTGLLIAARASRASAPPSPPPSPSPCWLRPSRPSAAAWPWASGRVSAASPSRLARWSAARSCRPAPGTGSSGSTSRSAPF